MGSVAVLVCDVPVVTNGVVPTAESTPQLISPPRRKTIDSLTKEEWKLIKIAFSIRDKNLPTLQQQMLRSEMHSLLKWRYAQ